MVSVASGHVSISSSSIRAFNQDKVDTATNVDAYTETGIELGPQVDSDEPEAEVVGLDQGPPQLPSILDQLLRLGFPSASTSGSVSGSSGSTSSNSVVPETSSSNQIVKNSPKDIEDDTIIQQPRPIVEIDLWADAGPGCGGVPWPAGQVSSGSFFFLLSVFLFFFHLSSLTYDSFFSSFIAYTHSFSRS